MVDHAIPRCATSFVLTALVLMVGVAACSSGGSNTRASTTTTAGTSSTAPGSTATMGGGGEVPGEAAYRSTVYDGTQHWICHPDLPTDECGPEPETMFAADGTVTHRPASTRGASPKVDCFYVYPTESPEKGINADLKIGPTEMAVVRAQVARYSSECRVFAPVYRQVTIGGIFSGGLGRGPARALAYGDVLDAWRTYLAQQNHGRGFVLIGHSQGSALLVKLMQDEIDPKPAVRSRLVSAIIMGGTVAVPVGKDVGGSFQHIPACRSAAQTGCVVSFVSFPAAALPATGSLFGRDPAPGQQALCVDPVGLAGHETATTVIARRSILLGAVTGLSPGSDPYIVLPGTLTARCVRANGFTVLAYAQASATDKRAVGTLLQETLGPTWGLHLYDANLPQNDLIAVVGTQASAWKPTR